MTRIESLEQAADALRAHANAKRAVRVRGGGTKLGWTRNSADAELDARGLNRIVTHNAGDFTAVLEGGVRLADAQEAFAKSGQMLALDPPLGADHNATLAGIVATNDSGPLRHRYGSMRDLLIGMTVVLSDGTIAKSGGQVIKNVAGYDLAKLFTGSYGTLGLIARVAIRLHPLPGASATLVAKSNDPAEITNAAIALARLPLEADCLDVSWSNGAGTLLIRFAGAAAEQRARKTLDRITLRDRTIETNDNELWQTQRNLQRSTGLVIKVSGRPTELAKVLRAADTVGATVVSRAALGLSWLAVPDDAKLTALRSALAPRACTVLDGADRVRDPWPHVEAGALALMQRVKMRFDPDRTLAPGIYAGGI